MKLLHEAMKSVQRLSNPVEDEDGGFDFDLEGGAEDSTGDDDFDLEGGQDDPNSLDPIVDKAVEDPNRQGLIRTVKKAHLVYKREAEDGTFEELWVFNVGDLKDELKTRKAILSGTDIPAGQTSSPDDGNGIAQEYKMWTAGNIEFIKITGLQN